GGDGGGRGPGRVATRRQRGRRGGGDGLRAGGDPSGGGEPGGRRLPGRVRSGLGEGPDVRLPRGRAEGREPDDVPRPRRPAPAASPGRGQGGGSARDRPGPGPR